MCDYGYEPSGCILTGNSSVIGQSIDHFPLQTLASKETVFAIFVSFCDSKLEHLVGIFKQ